MKRKISALLVVLLVAVSGYAGKEYGDSAGYQTGYKVGYEEGRAHKYEEIDKAYDRGYNDGVDDANSWLRPPKNQENGNTSAVDQLHEMIAQATEPDPEPEPVTVTVYITRTGEKYHRNGCQYLRQSKIAIELSVAQARGYGACSRCW